MLMNPLASHLRSVLISVPVGILVWITTGAGVARLGRALGGLYFGETMILPDDYVSDRGVDFTLAALLLVAAGLLYSGLLAAKLAPAGPVTVAVAYAGISLWAMVDPAAFGSTFPSELLGADRAVQAPAWGYAMLLAGPLAFGAVSPDGRGWLAGRVPPYLASAPLVWLATAGGIATLATTVGVYGLGEGLVLAPDNAQPLLYGLASVLLLLAAGLLYLLMLRGGRRSVGLPAVGLVFLGVSLLAMFDPELFLPPQSLYGTALADGLNVLVKPVWGYAVLLAVPMLVIPVYAALADRSTA